MSEQTKSPARGNGAFSTTLRGSLQLNPHTHFTTDRPDQQGRAADSKGDGDEDIQIVF